MKKWIYSGILLGILILTGYFIFNTDRIGNSFRFKAEIGQKIDSLNGVYVFQNGSTGNVSGRNVAPNGYNLGLKYQCVEFVKRSTLSITITRCPILMDTQKIFLIPH